MEQVMRKALLVALAAAAVQGGAAKADGEELAPGVRLQLGGGAAMTGVRTARERGVRLWRGAAPVALDLAGGEPAEETSDGVTVVLVNNIYYGTRYYGLRTQGFYSGVPYGEPRYTQGFYSGPSPGRRW